MCLFLRLSHMSTLDNPPSPDNERRQCLLNNYEELKNLLEKEFGQVVVYPLPDATNEELEQRSAALLQQHVTGAKKRGYNYHTTEAIADLLQKESSVQPQPEEETK